VPAWNKNPERSLYPVRLIFPEANMVDPFDLETALLAKHAQHVVLIHFSIALFITAVAFDLAAQWTTRRGFADAAYYNLLTAAINDVASSRHGHPRVAVPARGPETKGHPTHAPGAWVRLKRNDLAGVVGAFSRATTGRSLAALPLGNRISWRGYRRADGTFGRLFERRERAPLNA
jgi:hypothetical protein